MEYNDLVSIRTAVHSAYQTIFVNSKVVNTYIRMYMFTFTTVNVYH